MKYVIKTAFGRWRLTKVIKIGIRTRTIFNETWIPLLRPGSRADLHLSYLLSSCLTKGSWPRLAQESVYAGQLSSSELSVTGGKHTISGPVSDISTNSRFIKTFQSLQPLENFWMKFHSPWAIPQVQWGLSQWCQSIKQVLQSKTKCSYSNISNMCKVNLWP